MLPEFEILSYMFPQIEHVALEQSSALPSLFSKYGIRSLPAILLVNQTSRVRYRDENNLSSLMEFYQRNTGFEAMDSDVVGKLSRLRSNEHSTMKSLMSFSLKEISSREPYLALSIFGETSQVICRVLKNMNIIDLWRIWTKLRLCKTRNFHERARKARVWASFLASVSLGEPSSSAR